MISSPYRHLSAVLIGLVVGTIMSGGCSTPRPYTGGSDTGTGGVPLVRADTEDPASPPKDPAVTLLTPERLTFQLPRAEVPRMVRPEDQQPSQRVAPRGPEVRLAREEFLPREVTRAER